MRDGPDAVNIKGAPVVAIIEADEVEAAEGHESGTRDNKKDTKEVIQRVLRKKVNLRNIY